MSPLAGKALPWPYKACASCLWCSAWLVGSEKFGNLQLSASSDLSGICAAVQWWTGILRLERSVVDGWNYRLSAGQ